MTLGAVGNKEATMNAFCDGSQSCRPDQQTASPRANLYRGAAKLLHRGALLTAVLVLGGCSWFEDSEPAFPPSSGGPNIAAVPNGLPGDSGDADYSDQELRALLGSAPRPLPPPPAPPKVADTNTPDASTPNTNGATTAPAGASPETTPAATVAPQPAAGTVPAPAVPDAATTTPGSYPDINTVPMQRPTPVPDSDVAPQTTPAAPATPAATPDKPKQSSMLTPVTGDLVVLTTAGSSPTAPTPLAEQTAQTVTNSDDDMFSKPVLPAYSGYDQLQKQPQSVPAQSLYRSPYSNGATYNGATYNGPLQLGQQAGSDGSVIYAAQGDSLQAQSGASFGVSPGGQPVGLVYFGTGSTQLGGNDRQVLQQIAALQQAYGGVIRIVGHASSRTENMPMDVHQKTNADIAAARARAVAQQLVHYGVRPLFVQIAGASDTQPLYPEIMPAGEAANRRAEIYLSSN
jgi:outer membrane protein OmpA-like peptidoglycan-associated protein